MTVNELQTLGLRVKALRMDQDMKQGVLAAKINVTTSRIQKIECDGSRQPRCIEAIAAVFGVNPAWLHYGHAYAPMYVPEIPFQA